MLVGFNFNIWNWLCVEYVFKILAYIFSYNILFFFNKKMILTAVMVDRWQVTALKNYEIYSKSL